ncbi:MAG: aminodeoxychorismate synthase, component I, partial [Lentisphaerae bacterium]|nr:aminodeoxychorismate synthase, component I [Lentisphaerota bacterium]
MGKMVFVARGRRLIFDDPVEVLAAADAREVASNLKAVARGLRRGLYAAGFVSYEAAPAFDDALAVHAPSDVPLSWFGLYRKPARGAPAPAGDFRVGPWRPAVNKAEYNRCIGEIRRLITAGDVYQVNYTFPLIARFQGSAQCW